MKSRIKSIFLLILSMLLFSISLSFFASSGMDKIFEHHVKVLKSNDATGVNSAGEGATHYNGAKAQEERVKNIKNDEIAEEWRFVGDASKGIHINNKSLNKNSSCYQIALANKAWIPGGWTLNCVDKLNPKDVINSETAGLTYSDSKTIYILNKYTDYSILSVMVHEFAHAYDATYFNDADRAGIAAKLHMKAEDFYSSNYQKSPNEEWARGYSYCYTNLEVDPIKYPRIDCDTVDKYVKDVEERLGVKLHYRQGFTPLVPLNNRKNLPKVPYVK